MVDETRTADDMDVDESGLGDFSVESDFNLEEEYKPTPLLQPGMYKGAVTDVRWDNAAQCLVWTVTLAGNEVLANDGETPADGMVFKSYNYFPKAGDENIFTKSGKMTKRQAKINMLGDFQEDMSISINTKTALIDGISNGEWIGLAVKVAITLNEYKGKISNRVDRMSKDND